MSQRPLIGITSYLDEASWGVWRRPAALVPQAYVACVTRAGGVAVLLPPQESGAERVLSALDGLVLAGGPDVDPARYGAAPHPTTGAPAVRRDSWELAVLDAALDLDMPVLGVCRGMQVLNVALGGDLVQHLPDQLGDLTHQPAPGVFARGGVRVRRNSVLGGVLGAAAPVRCYHHQAIRRLGNGLQPSAWAPDETVEAVELPDRRFVVGVQWHPEEDQEDLRVFEALVSAAGVWAADRHAARPTPEGSAEGQVRPVEVGGEPIGVPGGA